MSLREKLAGRRATDGARRSEGGAACDERRDAASGGSPSVADCRAQARTAKRESKRSTADQRARERAARRAEVAEQARAVRASVQAQMAALEAAPSRQTPGTFVHLYSSRDDAMSVFADAAGHMVAVPTARLA